MLVKNKSNWKKQWEFPLGGIVVGDAYDAK